MPGVAELPQPDQVTTSIASPSEGTNQPRVRAAAGRFKPVLERRVRFHSQPARARIEINARGTPQFGGKPCGPGPCRRAVQFVSSVTVRVMGALLVILAVAGLTVQMVLGMLALAQLKVTMPRNPGLGVNTTVNTALLPGRTTAVVPVLPGVKVPGLVTTAPQVTVAVSVMVPTAAVTVSVPAAVPV